MKRVTGHLTYANVVATLALVFAMSGGALAAKHYLVTKQGQIKPSVLRALKGRAGATGKAGATGVAGLAGSVGATGAAGAPGIKGELGPVGPSDAYTNATPGQPIALPVGDYEVFASGSWMNTSGSAETVFCEIQGAGPLDGVRNRQTVGAGGQGTVNLVMPLHAPQGEELALVCSDGAGNTRTTYLNFELTAIKIGALHQE